MAPFLRRRLSGRRGIMPGQTPLNMMQPEPRRLRRRPGAPRRGRLSRVLALAAIVIVLGIGWSWLWYYSASIADRALAGWVDREAALGRVYECDTQSIGGFPFGLLTRCAQAAAAFNS